MRSLLLYTSATEIPHPIFPDSRTQLRDMQRLAAVTPFAAVDQCLCWLLGGDAGFSSVCAAGVPCASVFAAGFSQSHDLGHWSCEAPLLWCAAWPRSMAGIMAAMQPERNSAQVSAPNERSIPCFFMIGMGCGWMRNFMKMASGSSQLTTSRRSQGCGRFRARADCSRNERDCPDTPCSTSGSRAAWAGLRRAAS